MAQLKSYRFAIDRNKCIGASSCVALAPNTFELDEQDIVTITNSTGDDHETQLLAAQSCPVDAIKVIDQETGEQLWPLKS
jgi:ferredoxin